MLKNSINQAVIPKSCHLQLQYPSLAVIVNWLQLKNTIIICHVKANRARNVSLNKNLCSSTHQPRSQSFSHRPYPSTAMFFFSVLPKAQIPIPNPTPVTKREFGVLKISCTRFRGRVQKSSQKLSCSTLQIFKLKL